ncbi:hypothetical protein ACSTID_24200, partial [Vibrio parahaemolyticus]
LIWRAQARADRLLPALLLFPCIVACPGVNLWQLYASKQKKYSDHNIPAHPNRTNMEQGFTFYQYSIVVCSSIAMII